MRIWSLHPRLLDRQGLVACWREALLAQAVLAGATKGYLRHPQLERFRAVPEPEATIGAYLEAVAQEADDRGYRFDRTRIRQQGRTVPGMEVTTGQLSYEWDHLRAKLAVRSPEFLTRVVGIRIPPPHPLFAVVEGGVASWERASGLREVSGRPGTTGRSGSGARPR